DDDADARRRDGGERELAPDLVVAVDAAAGDGDPRRAVPGLDFEVDDAVEAERHLRRRILRVEVPILDREDIDLGDASRSGEVDLHDVGPLSRRAVGPAAARVPADAAAVAVVDGARRVVHGRTARGG